MRGEHLWVVQPRLMGRATIVAPSSQSSTPGFVRPPLYLIASLMLWAGALVLVVCVIALARQAEAPSDPFAPYAASLPDQFMGHDYPCDYACTVYVRSSAPASGLFSHITIVLSQGVIYETDFMVRKGVLTVGDLALLWGRPHVRTHDHGVTLTWPSKGIVAAAWAENGQFSYFLPVHRITFE